MLRTASKLLLILCLLLAGWAQTAQARVYIDVTKPFTRKLPLAMPAFQPLAGAAQSPQGAAGYDILTGDLSFTGLFDILDPKAIWENPMPET